MSNKHITLTTALFLLILLAAGSRVLAQLQDTTKLFAEFTKIQQDARKQPVSYDIRITSIRPGSAALADSMSGYMHIDGSRLHYLLNDVETIVNERYMIVLFKQNKSMYLARSSDSKDVNEAGYLNMRRMADDMQDWLMSAKGKEKVLKIRYKEGARCKSAEFKIDPRTGYITDAHIVMISPPENFTGGKEDSVQVLEVDSHFFNHKPLPASYHGFDESIYFTREGDTLKPTPAYREYQIFKASPNL
ncbi:hypothetical protein QFZ51_002081 [Chitinophaga sp. W3I9]|uniref:hypothetical protein n=1 Tax=unclassified Chitinophaga TaxID=2619133 RepID=UPI003D1C096A